MIEGRLCAAGLVGNLGKCKAHLDPAERAGEHLVVEVSKVSDPEYLAGESTKSVSQRHIAMFKDSLAKGVCIMTVRHQYGGQ